MPDQITDLVSDKCAQALKLYQRGYSHSGVASELDVTESTAKKYLRQLKDHFGQEALMEPTEVEV